MARQSRSLSVLFCAVQAQLIIAVWALDSKARVGMCRTFQSRNCRKSRLCGKVDFSGAFLYGVRELVGLMFCMNKERTNRRQMSG